MSAGVNAVRQPSSCSAIAADPCFADGYFDFWNGRAPRQWHADDGDAHHYEMGRQFGAWVMGEEGQFVPLTKHSMPNLRAIALLVVAMRIGEVI